MRVVLTGATGLLGRHLTPLLLEHHQVFAVGRHPVDGSEPVPAIDLGRPWRSELLPPQVDVVIHLAQSPRYRDFPEGASDVVAVNLSSTSQLLEYARYSGAKRFILASTGGIYRAGSSPITEDSELLGPAELGHYFATKLAAEMLASTYRPYMDVHILRIFFMYGPGQRDSMFLPSLIERIRTGRAVRLSGKEGIRINPIHAMDVARAICVLSDQGGPKTVNVAGPQITTIRSAAEAIAAHYDLTPSFELKPASSDLVASTAELLQLIQEHNFDFSTGLRDLLEKTP